MLQLKNIVKEYGLQDSVVQALKGVSLEFRQSEFVSILGQSGCGKTTMLNIIGGLDRYTSGDLLIDGISTKDYKDVDWDTYRNIRIGFIFQSYNLISHIDILSNVEMALTLSGVPAAERKERALKALADVGLSDHIHKRPNQLSGGQMQRVSIARALINNPHIILADEPTGALDSNTSVQIMELLKEISKDRLVIMVTHNGELAEQYSTRIVSLKDGLVINDTNPYDSSLEKSNIVESAVETTNKVDTKPVEVTKDNKTKKVETKNKKKALKKTSMSFLTAIKLSFNNLMTKKGRTILTAIAGSIGIIGVSLVLAISNGFQVYIDSIQTELLAGYPIEIATETFDTESIMNLMMGTTESAEKDKYPNSNVIYPYNVREQLTKLTVKNNITQEYVDYINKLDKNYYSSIYYGYGLEMNVVNKISRTDIMFLGADPYNKISASSNMMAAMTGGSSESSSMIPSVNWQELVGDEAYTLSNYDLLYGTYPQKMDEVVLVVDSSNQVSTTILSSMGFDSTASQISFEKIVNECSFALATNNQTYYYDETTGLYKERTSEELYKSDDTMKIKVTGVIRIKEGNAFGGQSAGIAYTSELTKYMLEDSMNSDIVKAQILNPTTNVITGKNFTILNTYQSFIMTLGGSDVPSDIKIYAKDFDAKENITAYLNNWNTTHSEDEKIQFDDMAALFTSTMSQMIKIVTIALVCFASVSLIVSSVMIGIITYVSVVERTKEIGILRSLGARKMDISRVFNAETGIIGFTAGMIGIIVTYILSWPINIIIDHFAGMTLTICVFNPLHALAMVILSICLTLIAGLIPSSIAAKRDPVIALRTE